MIARLLAASQVEERIVKGRAKRMITLAVSFATGLMVLPAMVKLMLLVLLGVLLLVMASKRLLAAVSRRFRGLLDHDNTRIVATLVEAQVRAGSIPGRFHVQFLRLTQL